MATSPLAWFNTFRKSLMDFGLVPSRIEPCLYTFDSKLFVLVYVDDLLFTGEDEEVARFKQFVSTVYQVKLQGEAQHFCGIEVARDERCIKLCQSKYVASLLERFNMADCKPARTPMAADPEVSPTEHQDELVAAKFPYRELVGSLMFLMTQTRPDISYAMAMLSRFLHNFRKNTGRLESESCDT